MFAVPRLLLTLLLKQDTPAVRLGIAIRDAAPP